MYANITTKTHQVVTYRTIKAILHMQKLPQAIEWSQSSVNTCQTHPPIAYLVSGAQSSNCQNELTFYNYMYGDLISPCE